MRFNNKPVENEKSKEKKNVRYHFNSKNLLISKNRKTRSLIFEKPVEWWRPQLNEIQINFALNFLFSSIIICRNI